MSKSSVKFQAVKVNGITTIFSALLIIEIFNGFRIHPLYIGAGLALMALSVISLYALKSDAEERVLFRIILFWAIYHIVIAIIGFSSRTAYICFQHIGILLFFVFVLECNRFGIIGEQIKTLYKIIHFAVLIVLLGVVLFRPVEKTSFESYIYIGLATFPFAINKWKWCRGPRLIVLCIAWVYVAYQIGARSQAVGFLLFIVVAALLLMFRNKGKKFIKNFFWVYYGLLNLFPMIYSYLSQSQYRTLIDGFAVKYTTARFFSGRDELWSDVYNQINSVLSALFGLGFGETENITVRWNMSLHSLYVTVLSEGGIFLVVILGLILYQIWKRLSQNTSYQSKILLAFMVVFLYKQSFDISLIENNLGVAFGVWTALGLGYIDAKHTETDEEYNFFTGKREAS